MPELPEVETVVRSLQGLVGRRILSAEFGQPRVLRTGADEMSRHLAGARIESVSRRGKFIVIALADRGSFLVHLGMTGKLLRDAEPRKHTHAILTLDQGSLVYEDARQFGRLEWSADLPDRVMELGPEPLTVEFAQFFAALRSHRTRIKALLLNQQFLAGVGNIYADEALFRAGIRPGALASSISRDRATRLYAAVQEVLREAIAAKGSSVSDYVDGDGNKGNFQNAHAVYRRTGQPCVRCGSPVKRILISQRGTHYCPRCQR